MPSFYSPWLVEVCREVGRILSDFCRSPATTPAARIADHECLYALCLKLHVEWMSCYTDKLSHEGYSRPFYCLLSGMTTSITQRSTVCAFITVTSKLSSPGQLSSQARHGSCKSTATQQFLSTQLDVFCGFRLRTYQSMPLFAMRSCL